MVDTGAGEAGGSASAMYAEYRRNHRRRWRWLSRSLLLVGVSLVLVGAVLMGPLTIKELIGFFLYMAGFVSVVLWGVVRDPPEWVENYQEGAEGERNTAKQLDALPEGWHVRHDVSGWDGVRGNLDHVVVGPRGVFLLDSKHWRNETVRVVDGRVTVGRTAEPGHKAWDASTQVKRAFSQAMDVRDRIKTTTKYSEFVTAVMVVWADPSPDLPAEVGNVSLVPGADLAEWLQAAGRPMHPLQVDRVWEALREG